MVLGRGNESGLRTLNRGRVGLLRTSWQAHCPSPRPAPNPRSPAPALWPCTHTFSHYHGVRPVGRCAAVEWGAWGPGSSPRVCLRRAFSAPAPTHPLSLLPAAVESTSKKPQGAGKVGDPKHTPPKVQGGSADHLKVSHLIPGSCFLTPGPCSVWGLRLGGNGSWERGPPASLVCLPTSITKAMATAKGAPQIPAAAPVIRKMR